MDPRAEPALRGPRPVGACAAPSTSMYFDPKGRVLACCHSHLAPLGRVTDSSLEEIWWGDAADRFRSEVAKAALPDACRHCRWQLADGNESSVFLHQFDRFGRPGAELDWPAQLEFAFSNRCNLECVMCNGDFSSTIRSRREGRSPLPEVYGESFFTELEPFLSHVRQTRYLGGEPFLVPEYQRIWDLLVAEGRPVSCDVTTNGTVWTPRMERTLAALPFSVGVSLDGVRRETVEAIRVGAEFDALMANVERFSAYCAGRGTPFTLTFCLMRVNWRELADFVRLADGLGAAVAVNTVTWPPHLSLYELAPAALGPVVDGLREAAQDLGDRGAVVAAEADRLQRWLDRRGSGPADAHFEHWSPVPPGWAPSGDGAASPEAALAAVASGPVGVIVTDAGDVVIDVPTGTVLGIPADEVVGRTYGAALRVLADRHGDLLLVADEADTPAGVERNLLFERDGRRTRARAITSVRVGGDGRPAGARTAVALVEHFPPT